MKFLSLSVFVIVGMAVFVMRANAFTKEDVIAMANECKEEKNASDDDIKEMMEHKPASTSEGKCMRACIMKKLGLMGDDGKMVKDKALELAKAFIEDETKAELAQEIVEACAGLEVSDDECEAANEYGICMKEHADAKGITSN